MKENMMGKKRSHYRSDTKRGFEAGELAGLLAKHSPTADYRIVINFRGRARELIVDEDEQTCATPADVGIPENRLPDDHPSQLGRPRYGTGSAFGGKVEAALHDPRTQNFQPEGQTWPAAPPWPESESVESGLSGPYFDPKTGRRL